MIRFTALSGEGTLMENFSYTSGFWSCSQPSSCPNTHSTERFCTSRGTHL